MTIKIINCIGSGKICDCDTSIHSYSRKSEYRVLCPRMQDKYIVMKGGTSTTSLSLSPRLATSVGSYYSPTTTQNHKTTQDIQVTRHPKPSKRTQKKAPERRDLQWHVWGSIQNSFGMFLVVSFDLVSGAATKSRCPVVFITCSE